MRLSSRKRNRTATPPQCAVKFGSSHVTAGGSRRRRDSRSPRTPESPYGVRLLQPPFVKVTRPANTAGQSVPVKSASILVVSAVPTLPKVPRHPRGEVNSPCVLISVGGLLDGVSAAEPVVVIASHGCSDRIDTRNVCRFVWGTGSNVHSIVPELGAGGFGSRGFTCNTRLPRQVPVRNEDVPEGAVGVDEPPPPQAARKKSGMDASQARELMRPRFLPGDYHQTPKSGRVQTDPWPRYNRRPAVPR